MIRGIRPRTSWERTLMAQIMLAEGINAPRPLQMVANVIANRARADCLDFKGLRNINDVVVQRYPKPGGGYSYAFESYLYRRHRKQNPKSVHLRYVDRALRTQIGPSPRSLWFFNPYGSCPSPHWQSPLQWFNGYYDEHCFYVPSRDKCKGVY